MQGPVLIASEDPLSLINDIQTAITSLSQQVTGTLPSEAVLRQTCHHIAEAASMLAASQILYRRTALLRKTGFAYKDDDRSEKHDDRRDGDDGMMVDSKPLMSMSSKSSDGGMDESSLLDTLEEDWKGIINGPSAIGEYAFARWLVVCLKRAFAMDDDDE